VADYVIHYLTQDGTLSMIYRPCCRSDEEAMVKGHRMRKTAMSMEVWRDLNCLEIFAGEVCADSIVVGEFQDS
jgi:hypothetical protein